jgi:hypothetical protein
MLLMVTNRCKVKGEYGNEEQLKRQFDYLYDYNHLPMGQDGFNQTGKTGFETSLLKELIRLRDELSVNTPKIGIFIHGYNSDYRSSLDQLYDLEKNLGAVMGYPPVLIGFSWPSAGQVTDYLSDREEVRDSVGAFTRFLLDVNEFVERNARVCFATTYCMAHSMGNYLLRKGMEYASDYLGNPIGRMLFAETLLLAPDLASEDIQLHGKGSVICDFSRRVHVYYSHHDRALKASSAKRFGGNRLGRHGANDYSALPENVIVVNANQYANSESSSVYKDRAGDAMSVHSCYKYHTAILADMVQVMSSVDRNMLVKREPVLPEPDPNNPNRVGAFFKNHYRLT